VYRNGVRFYHFHGVDTSSADFYSELVPVLKARFIYGGTITAAAGIALGLSGWRLLLRPRKYLS
jgi:hypothetical protein